MMRCSSKKCLFGVGSKDDSRFNEMAKNNEIAEKKGRTIKNIIPKSQKEILVDQLKIKRMKI